MSSDRATCWRWPTRTSAWGGAAAFYSLIHIPRARLPQALAEIWRVLRPGGVLLAAVHCGQETVHRDEWWGQAVSVDFIFFEPEELEHCLQAAGFVVDQVTVREPYPDVEYPSRRAYLMAHKPGPERRARPHFQNDPGRQDNQPGQTWPPLI